ncbi:MAG: hypothetical protein LBG45_09805, partial [Dysgonamonadaceae bacterium]|nr:hypothetical protein [Dysgonamonadaceae bacterium]
ISTQIKRMIRIDTVNQLTTLGDARRNPDAGGIAHTGETTTRFGSSYTYCYAGIYFAGTNLF